jgi:aminopeptidase N
MLEAWLGPDTFRAGIQRYMKAHAYSNATSADLWQALGAASHHDITAVAAGWTEQPGFPLLDVTAHCTSLGERTITATQQRFLMDGSVNAASHWKVPLLIRSGADSAMHPALLDESSAPIAAGRCGEALSVNANAIGYFRVRYNADLLKANLQAFDTLPAGDRLALLDDQWAMATAGRAPLADYISLAERLTPNDEPRAWQQVAFSMEVIELAERGSPGYDALLACMRKLLKPALLSLGWDSPAGETPDRRALRQQLIMSLGSYGDPDVLEHARKRYQAFVVDHGALPPDEQPAVLNVIASQADSATFEQLLGIAKSARNAAEIGRYYGALEKVQDPALAARVIDLALSKQLPAQANYLPLDMVFGVADRHQQLAWRAYSEHSDQLLAYIPMFASLTIAHTTPLIFWSGIAPQELEAYMRAHVPANMAPEVERGLQSGRVRLRRREILVSETDAWLRR